MKNGQRMSRPPVIIGSSLSGLLVSQSLSRAGIDHVLVGSDEPPPPIPRLGESLIDTSSPELWRLYGRELPECFHYKSHISYFNSNFASMVHLASPTRSKERVNKFAPLTGKPHYPWFGEGLFHLDRIAFDAAIYDKVRADKHCRFIVGRVARLEVEADAVTRLHLDDGQQIEPHYVFDACGYQSPVAKAAEVGLTPTSAPQRVIFTHYRRDSLDDLPDEWWRHGTNLMRLDREFDGIDGMSWLIPLGKTLSVGYSIDAKGEHGSDDQRALMGLLESAWRRRGLDFRPLFPEEQPIQELRHSYFVRDRACGKNWLLVGPSFITIWFPSSTGLWTVNAAASMAPRLLEKPELGKFYEQAMRQLLPFHRLLDGVARGPLWKSSWHAYRFFSTGGAYIWGRLAYYLRINDDDYGWFRPSAWLLAALSALGGLFWPFMMIFFVLALARVRLAPDRKRQATHFPLYFSSVSFRLWNVVRAVPTLSWAAIPRRRLPSHSAD